MKPQTFREFLNAHGGPTAVAVEIGVSTRSMHYWQQKRSRPTIVHAWMLLQLGQSEGLTLDTILEWTMPLYTLPPGFGGKPKAKRKAAAVAKR